MPTHPSGPAESERGGDAVRQYHLQQSADYDAAAGDLTGQDEFRAGVREYLANFAYGNATWPDLIGILERKTEVDLRSWSEVWVNTPGRPHFLLEESAGNTGLRQVDPTGKSRIWPQQFSVSERIEGSWRLDSVESGQAEIAVFDSEASAGLLNADGRGYGLFPVDPELLSEWESLDDIQQGSLLISLFENLLEGNRLSADEYLNRLIGIIELEDNQLLLNLMLRQVRILYWNFLSEAARLTPPSMLKIAVGTDADRGQPEQQKDIL